MFDHGVQIVRVENTEVLNLTGIRTHGLVETAGTFYILQACIQGHCL